MCGNPIKINENEDPLKNISQDFSMERQAEMWIRMLTVRLSDCYGPNDKVSIPSKVKTVLRETSLEYLVEFRDKFRTQWNVYDGAFLQK